MKIRKLLVLTYFFPPTGGSGIQRPLKFIKYLPNYGVHPVVFCPKKIYWRAHDDSNLESPFLKNVKIYRCGVHKLKKYYQLRFVLNIKNHPYFMILALKYIWFLDFMSAWYFECRDLLHEIIYKEGIDCIYTTSPPHSIHLFGRYLKRRLGLPWIMDLRDAMANDPSRSSNIYTCFQSFIEMQYEKLFYKSADAIITVSAPIKDSILSRHKTMGLESKIHVITNGFDEEDYKNLQRQSIRNDKFTVTYTGSFIGNRSPEIFLKAIKSLVATDQIDRRKLLIRFIGNFESTTIELFRQYAEYIPLEILGFQPHNKSLRYQLDSDMLLLIVNVSNKDGGNQIMTGKFFEYVGAGRPIFALVPEGVLKQTIINGRFGLVVPQHNPSVIAAEFKKVYEQWKTKGHLDLSTDSVLKDSFTRRHLTQSLAALIHSQCGLNRPPSDTFPSP